MCDGPISFGIFHDGNIKDLNAIQLCPIASGRGPITSSPLAEIALAEYIWVLSSSSSVCEATKKSVKNPCVASGFFDLNQSLLDSNIVPNGFVHFFYFEPSCV